MLRRIFGDSSSHEFVTAVRRPYRNEEHYQYGPSVLSRASSIVACLTMNAIFPKERREYVVNGSSRLLDDVKLYTFGVYYKRSIFERLGSAAAIDLTPTNGFDRFMETVGVDISGCTSIDEILERVEVFRVVNNRVNRRVVRAIQVLREVVHEDCVICMEKMEKASIIQPCFHVVCNECLPRLATTRRCPMCRQPIQGAVISDVVGKRTHQEAFEAEEEQKENTIIDTDL